MHILASKVIQRSFIFHFINIWGLAHIFAILKKEKPISDETCEKFRQFSLKYGNLFDYQIICL